MYTNLVQKQKNSWLIYAVCACFSSLLSVTKTIAAIGQLHDDVILLQLPESFSLLFSFAN